MNDSVPHLTKATPVSMKGHERLSEKWLHEILAEDPSLLGLGDLAVIGIERRQPRAGRLDMLLRDKSTETRYEVEIQLGATDESHIIRAIEYWDIEKNRYPLYDHVAVLVAEDVTSRFLNVISLLNRSVPLVAIQMNAWEVGGQLTLTATRVLDLMPSVPDDVDDSVGQRVDRDYWDGRASSEAMRVVDAVLELVGEATGDSRLGPNYRPAYIGMARSGVSDNFIVMYPPKSSANLSADFRIPRSDELTARIADAGLERGDYEHRYGCYRIRLTAADFTQNRSLLTELVQRAANIKPDQPVEELEIVRGN